MLLLSGCSSYNRPPDSAVAGFDVDCKNAPRMIRYWTSLKNIEPNVNSASDRLIDTQIERAKLKCLKSY
jgi:hypothetical protein